jgi:hypothetical protein
MLDEKRNLGVPSSAKGFFDIEEYRSHRRIVIEYRVTWPASQIDLYVASSFLQRDFGPFLEWLSRTICLPLMAYRT